MKPFCSTKHLLNATKDDVFAAPATAKSAVPATVKPRLNIWYVPGSNFLGADDHWQVKTSGAAGGTGAEGILKRKFFLADIMERPLGFLGCLFVTISFSFTGKCSDRRARPFTRGAMTINQRCWWRCRSLTLSLRLRRPYVLKLAYGVAARPEVAIA